MKNHIIKVSIIFLTLFFLIFSLDASAGPISSEALYGYCKVWKNIKDKKDLKHVDYADYLKFLYCTGYVVGVVDGYYYTRDILDKANYTCPPKYLPWICHPNEKEGFNVAGVIEMFLGMVESGGPMKNTTAREAILVALHLKYPCMPSDVNSIKKPINK